MSTTINDGYTLDFHVPGRGPWSAINGKYRPALAEACYEYQEATKGVVGGKKRMAAALRLILGAGTDPHIRSWDKTDAQGNPVAVSEAELRKLPAPQIDKLLDIVSGYGLEEQEADQKN